VIVVFFIVTAKYDNSISLYRLIPSERHLV